MADNASLTKLQPALAKAGEDAEFRRIVFDRLAAAERGSKNPATFRHDVRWPIIEALLHDKAETVRLANGLVFEVRPQSRIEKALLLSLDPRPDHVWEPQTTRLACRLAKDCTNVIVGGAYIGDQALFVAKVLESNGHRGVVIAFEPHPRVYRQLSRHVEINNLKNVRTEQKVLWDRSGVNLELRGGPALTSAFPDGAEITAEESFRVPTVTVDDYLRSNGIDDVDLIMLDTEGAEETALAGAERLLGRDYPAAPHIIFEVYSRDWKAGVASIPLIRRLIARGFEIFAIRDLQGNLSMEGTPIEIIPLNDVYVPDVPHGFNMLATKDKELAEKYGFDVVKNVSPKLLSEKDVTLPYPPKNPALHLPSNSSELGLF